MVRTTKNERRQYIRRMMWTGVTGSLVLILLLLFANELGFFRGNFAALMTLIWLQIAGYLVFFVYMRGGRNRAHADPSMLKPLLVWTTTVILAAAWFVDQIRLCVMIMFFLFMLEGALRLKPVDFILLSVYAVIGYLAIIVLVEDQYPENINRNAELMQWAAFALAAGGSAVLAGEVSYIRYQLKRRRKQNETAKARLEELAIKDELTRLFNRRHAMTLLRHHKGLADRGAYQFAVCYMDIDHFKQVNDSFGHPVGDVVLQRVAQAALAAVSNVDHVTRFGGEEFVLLFVKSDMAAAQLVCERLRRAVAEIDFSDIDRRLRIAASFGLTMYRTPEKIETLLSRADEALYAAKQGGRNRLAVI